MGIGKGFLSYKNTTGGVFYSPFLRMRKPVSLGKEEGSWKEPKVRGQR